jgi:hypothetical protein
VKAGHHTFRELSCIITPEERSGNLLNLGIDKYLGIGHRHRSIDFRRTLWCGLPISRNHIVSTTRNSASPLNMRAYASAAFSSG